MRRMICGIVLLTFGLLLLAVPFSGIAGSGWSTLAPEEMAAVHGGLNCMYNDPQACEGHPEACGNECYDNDPGEGTTMVCDNFGDRQYIDGSSQPGFPYCKSSSVEEGHDDCMLLESRTVCYRTWVCPPACQQHPITGFWYCPDGSNEKDEEIHNTFDVDYESPLCPPLT